MLIGRAEMVSLSQHISTSYSCNDPCPPYYGGSIDPFFPPVVIVGNAGSSAAWETMYYDWGYTVGPYAVSATWTVDNPVGTIDPLNAHATDLTGTTAGNATLDGFIATQPDYVYDGRDCYYLGTYDEGGQTPVQVTNVEKIQYKRNGTWTDMAIRRFVGGLQRLKHTIQGSGRWRRDMAYWTTNLGR